MLAYEELRRAILEGELRPNARLVEAELAERLNISRTPLREGLARLSSEGLVVRSHRSWVVREYTPKEVSDIHEVRAGLEGMAAFLMASVATDEEIEELAAFHRSEVDEHLDAIVSPPGRAVVDYNDVFHEAIVRCSGNTRLHQFVRQNREFFFTYRIANLYSPDELRQSLRGHNAIVEALEARDSGRAQATLRDHVLEARDLIISKLY